MHLKRNSNNEVIMKKWMSLAAIVAALVFTAGCERGDAERAGEKLDKAAEETKDGFKKAGYKIGDAAEKAGDKIKDATR
jgi:hypothetical protein